MTPDTHTGTVTPDHRAAAATAILRHALTGHTAIHQAIAILEPRR